MKELTYLIYIVFWELLCFAPVFYAVFWKDASGLWFLLAIMLSQSAYTPDKWGIEGAKPSIRECQYDEPKSDTLG